MSGHVSNLSKRAGAQPLLRFSACVQCRNASQNAPTTATASEATTHLDKSLSIMSNRINRRKDRAVMFRQLLQDNTARLRELDEIYLHQNKLGLTAVMNHVREIETHVNERFKPVQLNPKIPAYSYVYKGTGLDVSTHRFGTTVQYLVDEIAELTEHLDDLEKVEYLSEEGHLERVVRRHTYAVRDKDEKAQVEYLRREEASAKVRLKNNLDTFFGHVKSWERMKSSTQNTAPNAETENEPETVEQIEERRKRMAQLQLRSDELDREAAAERAAELEKKANLVRRVAAPDATEEERAREAEHRGYRMTYFKRILPSGSVADINSSEVDVDDSSAAVDELFPPDESIGSDFAIGSHIPEGWGLVQPERDLLRPNGPRVLRPKFGNTYRPLMDASAAMDPYRSCPRSVREELRRSRSERASQNKSIQRTSGPSSPTTTDTPVRRDSTATTAPVQDNAKHGKSPVQHLSLLEQQALIEAANRPESGSRSEG